MTNTKKAMLATMILVAGIQARASGNPYGDLAIATVQEREKRVKQCQDYYRPKIADAKKNNDEVLEHKYFSSMASYSGQVSKTSAAKMAEINAAAKAKGPVPAPAVFPEFVPQEIVPDKNPRQALPDWRQRMIDKEQKWQEAKDTGGTNSAPKKVDTPKPTTDVKKADETKDTKPDEKNTGG